MRDVRPVGECLVSDAAVWLKLGVLTVSALQYRSRAVTEDKIAKAVAYCRKKLDARPHPPESLSQAPGSRLQVIVKRAGAQRRSTGLLVQLESAFKAAGILTFPPLTDPFLKPSDRVRMLDAHQPLDGLAPQRELFSTEKELEGFIWARREHINAFRKRGLTGFQEQGQLDGGRRVDILCKRPSANQLVAIELKAAQPDDRSAGQIQQYR